MVWGTGRLDNCRVWGGGGIVAWGHGMVGFVCLIDHCSVVWGGGGVVAWGQGGPGFVCRIDSCRV